MSKRNIQLKILVSPEENEIIRKNAKACDLIPSAYVRGMALNMYILPCDYTIITEHSKEISGIRNAITQLVFTIRKRRDYVPMDLEYILERMKEIIKLQKQFLQDFRRFEDRFRDEMEQTVRTVVQEHLSKTNPGN